jgi:predicted RNase H-like nuclease (RuvC/YqgF family)
MGKTLEELVAENEQLQAELIEFDEQSKQLEQELEAELAKVRPSSPASLGLMSQVLEWIRPINS